MTTKVVFEVAIYRLSFEGWTKDVGERIDRRAEVRLAQYTRPITASDRVQERISAEQFERPNCWDYNEIIAWIRLVWDGPGPVIKGYMFALGSQGSYKFKERFRRGFVPHPFLDGSPNYKVLEEWFDDGESNDEIYERLREALCKITATGGDRPRRHLDLRAFDAVGPKVDWRAVMTTD